jgi:ubiquinol-cytochrome c reductase cytochrome c subunit
MSMRKALLAVALAGMVIASTGMNGASAQTSAAAPPPGDVSHGKTAYMRYGCYACHGTVGQGSDFTAPKLAPNPKPYAFFLSYIRKPARMMPAQSAMFLPDSETADIYAYLQAVPPGKPFAGIPALAGITTSARR